MIIGLTRTPARILLIKTNNLHYNWCRLFCAFPEASRHACMDICRGARHRVGDIIPYSIGMEYVFMDLCVLSVISFTRAGYELSEKLNMAVRKSAKAITIYRYVKCAALPCREQKDISNQEVVGEDRIGEQVGDTVSKDIIFLEGSIADWAKEQFGEHRAVVFIGAVGIAVRAIAGCVESKLTDSPVIVIDEQGNYVIPLLSGHVGGANELAVWIADLIGAVPVITTATDLEHRFAVDVFAKKNQMVICNKDGIAKVTAKVLEGKPLRMAVPEEVLYRCCHNKIANEAAQCMNMSDQSMMDTYKSKNDPESGHTIPKIKMELLKQVSGTDIQLLAIEALQSDAEVDVLISEDNWRWKEAGGERALLYLAPKEYVIGIGCKRGEPYEDLRAFVQQCIEEQGIVWDQVACISSIDRKEQEEGILELSRQIRVPFLTYTAEELEAVEGDYAESEFVKDTVGVGNVCERAAVAACGDAGVVIQHKRAYNGKTVAIAKRKWSVRFEFS